jgi:TonB family protein
MAISLAAHLALAWAFVHVIVPLEKHGFDTIDGIQVVEAEPLPNAPVAPRVAPATAVPVPTPRSGDPRNRPTARPVDALAKARRAGAAAGHDRPRPRPEQLVGDDLDDLRFRPYDHPDRDTPRRSRSAERSARAPDSRQPRARLAGADLPAPAGGGHPVVAVWQRDSESGAVPDDRSQPDRARLPPRRGLAEAPSRRAVARAPHQHQHLPGAVTPSSAARATDREDREAASPTRLPDLVDMARTSGAGRSAAGRGAGSWAGRRGDPRGRDAGEPIWLNSLDQRFVAYLRRIHRKVQPLWRFPNELELTMEQGEVLVQFTVLADGQVVDVAVRKSSGFPRFDQVATAAIRRAAPFDPIPRRLGASLNIVAPFEFNNPMVR